MELLTIGAFARAARLTPKALRLYERRGILTPERVDPASGYRLYRRDQLEHARFVAWLRRLGMPLSRISHVLVLEPRAAAEDVATYWREVQVDVAARADIAALLIEHLRRKDDSMTGSANLAVHAAARCENGRVREFNQDAAYAGEHLLAVADGFGSGTGTLPASAVAIDAITSLDTTTPGGDLLDAVESAAARAESAVRTHLGSGRTDAGTTLTAMLHSGTRRGLVHVGDGRVYLLRGGELSQATRDHTIAQSLVDEGKIAVEQVPSHPDHATLFKAFTGESASSTEPELSVGEVEAGDRYLLCSDGLHTVVSTARIRECLTRVAEPDSVVSELVALADEAGGPDNIACVVADVVSG